MEKKIILTEEQFYYILNEASGAVAEFSHFRNSKKHCYIGSFFVFELKGIPNIRRKKHDSEAETSIEKVEIKEGRIGSYLGTSQYDVFVYYDDGGNIPHVHVLDHTTKGEEFDCCIRLDCVEYFSHGNHITIMNRQQKKAFNSFMHQRKKSEVTNISNYAYAVETWNDNNSNVRVSFNYDANGDIIIPDYSKLQ